MTNYTELEQQILDVVKAEPDHPWSIVEVRDKVGGGPPTMVAIYDMGKQGLLKIEDGKVSVP